MCVCPLMFFAHLQFGDMGFLVMMLVPIAFLIREQAQRKPPSRIQKS